MATRRWFYEGLATLLGAGIPIRAALEDLAARRGRGSLAAAVASLRDAVGAGGSLADAMDRLRGEFSPLERALVRAGETSGRLEEAARSLAALEERRERTRNSLVAGLAYPVLVLHLVPVPVHVAKLVQGSPGGFLAGWLSFVLPLWILAGVAWWWLRGAPSRAGRSRLVASIPLVGPVLRDFALARWARTFGALEEAGLPADVQLREAAQACDLAHLTEPLALAEGKLRTGATRAEALAGAGLPDEVLGMVATGEKSGALGSLMAKVADSLDGKAELRLATAVKLAPVAAILLAGIGVFYAFLSVLGPYYGQIDK